MNATPGSALFLRKTEKGPREGGGGGGNYVQQSAQWSLGASGRFVHTLASTIHSIILTTYDGHACIMDIVVIGCHRQIFLLVPLAPIIMPGRSSGSAVMSSAAMSSRLIL